MKEIGGVEKWENVVSIGCIAMDHNNNDNKNRKKRKKERMEFGNTDRKTKKN